MKKSELLLPVGNYEMCLAAIHGGADAIYVGMPTFNARGRTEDLGLDQLKEIIDTCHLYGVKVHVAFNILIFEDELESAIQTLHQVVALGPDAFIVQDLGLAKIIKSIYPQQVIHASTQMTVTNEQAIEFLEDLDIKRFVLGRENSIKEIQQIRDNTDKELEVFVHGALCVAYSGQCFTSESIGGRSANRGQCAQSCRFSYDMIVDGVKKNLIDQQYLVSPQDLCGINEVPTLQEIGIESFKVEGRLKSPTFVGTVAQTYQKAIQGKKVSGDDIDNMAITYSRGFFPGWLHGVDHQGLVHGRYQSHRGVYLGKILGHDNRSIIIQNGHQLSKGMGLYIYNPKTNKELGSPIYDVKEEKGKFRIQLSKDINISKLKNEEVYLNSSPELTKNIEKIIKDPIQQRHVMVNIELIANVGSPLSYKISDGINIITVSSDVNLEPAKKEIELDKLKKDVEAISRTAYRSKGTKLSLSSPQPFIPNKVLKKIRQEAVAKLNDARISIDTKQANNYSFLTRENKVAKNKNISFLLRDIEQVKAFVDCAINSVNITTILDFEFGKNYEEALKLLQGKGINTGIATNRILKPGEYHHLNLLVRLKPDFILARNLGAFHYLKKKDNDIKIRGDFSLNVANSQTANYLLNKGFETLTSSYDLNSQQLLHMLKGTDASKIEITVHQYMPSFHMEHCVFAAFLSNGSSFKDCGKPCEEHKVELKDQFGNHHYIKADQECRNTMFNAVAQSASGMIDELTQAGVSNFRVEFLYEQGPELTNKVNAYINFIEGNIDINELKEKINVFEKYGLGSGQLFKQDSYEDRKKS
jgi:putative protease